MKKLIVSLFLFSLMAGMALAARVGIEARKAVNGAYEYSTPIEIDLQSKLPFLPKAYLKTQPVFTSPRGEFFSSLASLNHSRFDAVVGSGIILFGGNLEFETGGSYWWSGNSAGVSEGWEWQNTARYYFEF